MTDRRHAMLPAADVAGRVRLRATLRRWTGAAAAGIVLAIGWPATQASVPHAAYRSRPFEERIDALVIAGTEDAARAIAQLHALEAEPEVSSADRRSLLFAMGLVEAMNGRTATAGAYADRLLEVQADDPSGRTLAAANLIRAQAAERTGQLDVAAALAQSALPAFEAGCPGAGSDRVDLPCAYRPAWRALQILERRAQSQGLSVSATAHAQAAYTLAEWAGDARRRIINLSALAVYASGRGERELAQRLIGQARHIAAQTDDPADRARVLNTEARLANARGDAQGAVQYYNEALQQATAAHSTRLEATLLNNLSDVYGRMGRAADALRAADRALVLARLHNDIVLERILLNNAGIAKIGLGRIAEGKRDLAQLTNDWAARGETGREASTLLEFGQALANAGDARGALDLYHRERALSAELMRANRSIALKELQTRFESDAREHDIELLARDNALKTAALTNRDLLQRIWWSLAVVMLLAIALVAILYRKVRETRERLEASRLQLQAQSDRDPLTNLANRRHFQDVMARLDGSAGFEGALLLVDIDHFKHVNDQHGHAAGDRVLVEVARRLNEAVRSDDLVVRWGGEEFLILAPRASADQARQVATRVLRVLGRSPIPIGDAADATALRITASIGYGRFPLPPDTTPVPWEQAVNLADMALYTAKNQGRNRAVGIVSATAPTGTALREIESDFDRAWHEGRVTLVQTPGAGRARVGHRRAAGRRPGLIRPTRAPSRRMRPAPARPP